MEEKREIEEEVEKIEDFKIGSSELDGALVLDKELRVILHQQIVDEFAEPNIRAWVRHELEEIIGGLIWRIRDRILDAILKKVEEAVLEKGIESSIRGMAEEEIRVKVEEILDSRKGEIAQSAVQKVVQRNEIKIEEVVSEELEKQRPKIEEKVNEYLSRGESAIVRHEVSLMLDKYNDLDILVRKIQRQVEDLSREIDRLGRRM